MHSYYNVRSRGVALAAMIVILTACGGNGIEGTYKGGDDSLLDSLTFKSGGIVDVRIANGIGGEGTYAIADDKVTIVANGTTHVLTIAGNGCLQGELMVGTLCPEGGASKSPAGDGVATLAGKYEARTPDGSMALDFLGAQQARMTITDAGGSESEEVTYRISGNQVMVTGPTGESMALVRKGDMLEADMGGIVVRFSRK